MKRERFENPWAWSALGRARQLVNEGREPEAFEVLGTGMMVCGWSQNEVAWGGDEGPAVLWETWLRLRYARELILLRMILQPRERWIDAWTAWKETARELTELADRDFVLGPAWWRTGRKPSRRLTLQDELDEIHRAAGHRVIRH